VTATDATSPPVAVGVLARLKLTEPVRLYLWSVSAVLFVGLNLAGVLTGEWQAYATSSAAVLLGVLPATAAARASVFSPRSVVQTAIRARQ
jgi:hypothetical protein